ncbi:DNA-binding protein [Clostridium phage HM T]|uniref:DNA-binding protein n=1 Tax=Clostridium saccharoperbutylacetonicum N1-4(HMT) TaxID=931276 RepID=M1MIW3_9CLOT|nr:helix-turn-helix transcriptional regulator [Clostridium saccharoperbutylacetonicum]AMB17419.1 DNA-binding protein [Clostridium phage HM T]AGF54771.1 DNA-binding protein [Clostridium saccharoperbutylacetonicum N1-4(HMT)]NRT58708.1 transcriptional regulator with XRE-family HTH domain [Clostridium saccharoperbutylacetonicum]NSB27897.1 transcriptional regulator with XRE-family HTH domain [Clostridium saccharoperbutylacetonicum]NSB41380.1 transcriptional regulator with XRE-family HTH domain [Clo
MLLKDRLKELRLERDLLQKDIAQILNLTTSAYGYYEQGKRVPDSETIKILSNFYNVSSDYLLGMSDVRNYTKDSNITIALNSDTDYDELPKEAKDEINNFIEYIKQKYKNKK